MLLLLVWLYKESSLHVYNMCVYGQKLLYVQALQHRLKGSCQHAYLYEGALLLQISS